MGVLSKDFTGSELKFHCPRSSGCPRKKEKLVFPLLGGLDPDSFSNQNIYYYKAVCVCVCGYVCV